MDRAAKQQQRASAPPPVVRRTSRYDHYTTVVMRRLSNPFRLRRSSTGNTSEAVTVRLDNTASSKSQQSPSLGSPIVEKQHIGATELTSTQLGFELEQIQTHVDITRARIRHLQELIEYEEPTVSRVTELKRQLKDTHRDLEKLYFQVRGEHGDKTADPIRDVVRGVWQAYRSMVELEEKLRSGMSVVSSPVMESVEKSESGPDVKRLSGIEVKQAEEKQQQGVYIPTGVRNSKKIEQVVLKPRNEKDGLDSDDTTMSGALQMTRQQRAEVRRASSDALSVLEAVSPSATAGYEENQLDYDEGFHSFPKFHSYRDSHGSAYTRTEQTHPEQWPQPRGTVAMRLKREEANVSLTLRRPDRVRRGSCNGFTITDMIMRGIEDHRFVIPKLQHIKNHEIRVLKQWLVEEGYVQMTGLISCTEKLLHCLHLLQTGNRYESIAVLFSRSPQQVKDSCHEVMGGLLELYNETIDGDCEHEVYAPLWSICKKFVVNAQKAEAYYGFRWMDLVQVLVALNLYIGRSRGSPSPFKGQPFDWARFLLAKRSAQLRHTSPRVREVRDSSEESDSDDGSDDLSIYDTPVIRIVPFLRDRA